MPTPWRDFRVFAHQSLTRNFTANDWSIRDKPLPACQADWKRPMVYDANMVGEYITLAVRGGVFGLVLGLNPNLNRAGGRRYHTNKYRGQTGSSNQTGLNCSKACRQSKQ